jgi:hypothetical protein
LARAVALVWLGTAPLFAAEDPIGCDKFKWPIERERAALTAPDRVKLVSGGELAALPSTGMTLALRAPGEANLPSQWDLLPRRSACYWFHCDILTDRKSAGTNGTALPLVALHFSPTPDSRARNACPRARQGAPLWSVLPAFSPPSSSSAAWPFRPPQP